jgi:hypothetical protein
MTKFISTEQGCYINLCKITQIYVENGNIFACSEKLEWIIASGFEKEQDAQEWLDKFMQKYGLCVEPITTSRCF